MKPREPRLKVLTSARFRDGCGWNDARILNLSSRGLLLRASKTPQRGTYVEVCKGPHLILARVVWVKQDRFGLFTQDRLPVEAIASGAGTDAPKAAICYPERQQQRRELTAAERHERSRSRSSSMQFLWVLGIGVAAGTVAFEAVTSALARPLSIVSAELDRNH